MAELFAEERASVVLTARGQEKLDNEKSGGNNMIKMLALMLAILLTARLSACEAALQALGNNQPLVRRVASDGAQTQKENPQMPTRVIENGTRINMRFGDVTVPGILNDSETARALIGRLPYTVRVNRYSHDFCGVMDDPLPYSEENVHYGWLNGDIDFATDANYFTILFEDEENSEQYGYQVNIGVIDCELSRISKLRGSYEVLIELAE